MTLYLIASFGPDGPISSPRRH